MQFSKVISPALDSRRGFTGRLSALPLPLPRGAPSKPGVGGGGGDRVVTLTVGSLVLTEVGLLVRQSVSAG